MERNCTYCGNSFVQQAKRGRPQGFCSDACRGAARRNPRRTCQHCDEPFFQGESGLPFHCSTECRDLAKLTCLHCQAPTSNGRFCSGECVAAHNPTATCLECKRPIPMPTTPPFNRMPRFCGEQCRSNRATNNHGPRPWQSLQALQLQQMLEYMATPLHDLPQRRGWYEPFNIPNQLAPELPACTARVANSVTWWNHYLTTADPPALYVAHLGRTGWGGADTPTGCLPLFKCWPWITPDARAASHWETVIGIWRNVAAMHSHTPTQVQRTKERLRASIQEFQSSTWVSGPRAHYFLGHEDAPSKFIRDLVAYTRMLEPPPDSVCYLPDQLASLNSDAFDDHYSTWEAKRKRHRYAQKWKDDPPIPTDRTHQQIEEILNAERSKQ